MSDGKPFPWPLFEPDDIPLLSGDRIGITATKRDTPSGMVWAQKEARMTPSEKYTDIETRCAPVTFRGVPIKADVSVEDIAYLLARVRRAEELLRDAAAIHQAHYMTRDADEVNAFLAGEGE